jgi:hypothetical protein
MRYTILTFAILGYLCPAWSTSVPSHYSELVKYATDRANTNFQHVVYIGGYVKSPGAYPFTNPMTIADVVAKAGGLALPLDEHGRPTGTRTISVYRPSKEDPDPAGSIFRVSIEFPAAEDAPPTCKFELHEGDYVMVSASGCVP